ncbi:MAG: hypothetical protein JNM70_14665 [Anaerolineae bacterium]|nr:hypothetical protein [Anaerolineae bacterium]
MKRGLTGLVLILLCGLMVGAARAQDDGVLTYVSQDGSFKMDYPDYWEVDEDGAGLIMVASTGNNILVDGIEMVILLPSQLEASNVLTARVDSADELLDNLLRTSGGLEVDDPEPIESPLEDIAPVSGLRANLTQSWLRERDLADGYLLVIELDDSFVVMLVGSSNVTGRMLDGQVFLLVSTFEFGSFEPAEPAVRENREAAEIIDGLRGEEIIPSGGELLISEDFLASGSEGLFELFENARYTGTDFVVAADISFRPFEGVPPYCGLLTRVEPDGRGTDGPGLFIGWDADSQVVLYDNDDPPPRGDLILEQKTSVDIFTPHRLIAVLVDGELTVFVDGESIIEGENLRLPRLTEDETFFGVSMNPSCVMTGVWVWGWP